MGTPEQALIATTIAGPMVSLGLLDYLSYREGGRTLVGMIRGRFSSGE